MEKSRPWRAGFRGWAALLFARLRQLRLPSCALERNCPRRAGHSSAATCDLQRGARDRAKWPRWNQPCNEPRRALGERGKEIRKGGAVRIEDVGRERIAVSRRGSLHGADALRCGPVTVDDLSGLHQDGL